MHAGSEHRERSFERHLPSAASAYNGGKTAFVLALPISCGVFRQADLADDHRSLTINCFVVISGCSGGGKSSLLAELARQGTKEIEAFDVIRIGDQDLLIDFPSLGQLPGLMVLVGNLHRLIDV